MSGPVTSLLTHSHRRLIAPLAIVCLGISACRTLPPPPYPLAFTIDGASPRLLETSRETAVAVVVSNTGQRAWDPSRVHLSYHWLWLVPRELATRSRWNVPYQNGIRTELGTRVLPGKRVAVQGRLLPPEWPGVYWLQWDMVEEGVAWFSQASPRPSRRLVVVLPPAAWLLAPLPLAVALVGLFLLGRKRADSGSTFVRHADLVWCLAVFAVKPLLVVHDALLEPTATAYWLTFVAAVVPAFLAWALLPPRVRPWITVGVGIFASTLVIADVVYYRFFGDVLSAPAVLAAGQTGHVWQSVRTLLSPSLVWAILDWPFAVALAWRLTRFSSAHATDRPRRLTPIAIAAAVIAIAVVLPTRRAITAAPLDQMFRDRAVVEQLGLFGYHVYDGWNYVRATWLRVAATDDEVRQAAEWFSARASVRAAVGPLAGAARGRNLIVIQVESLQDFVVDARVGDQEVMPHLRSWTTDAVRFTNVTDETNQGRTSDAEFTAMTSLLPLDHGAVAFRYPGNHYVAIPQVLREHGYATLSAVPFEPGFWNRQVMHPVYGFQRSLFEPDFQLSDQIGWGLNDHDFLQQMVPRLEQLPRPFAAWLITLSLHHPFDDFPDRHKTLALGALDRTSFGNYLHTMRFFDSALDAFVSALRQRGLLDSSLIVVFGDHDAGFQRDAAIARRIGIDDSEAAWVRQDRVPLFVRLPGSPALSGRRDVAAGQTDLAPTLLGLLGIDAAPLPYVGRNLLGRPGDDPVVRPHGDWIDNGHLFLARGSSSACYRLDGSMETAGDCRAADRAAARTRDVARLVVAADLQQRLRSILVAEH